MKKPENVKNYVDFALYTPAIASIGMNCPGGMSDAVKKFVDNVKDCNEEHTDDGIPAQFQPNYAELHNVYAAMDSKELAWFDFHSEAWVRIYNEHYKEFAGLWNEKDYIGMIRLMMLHDDPGPSVTNTRELWLAEKEQLEEAGNDD